MMKRCSAALLLLMAALAGRTSAATDDFAPCADAANDPLLAGSQCARFVAPLDHAHPGASIELFLRRFPAAEPAGGRVWLIAGGPGDSGATLYPFLATLRQAFPGYDLIFPDHRGTGFSTRLCPREEAAASPGGALIGAEWGACAGALRADPARARAFTISNAARDLQAEMNRYGGPGKTLLYGVSYGTQLVLRTMRIAPPRQLDGIILDSLVPAETDRQRDLSHGTQLVDQVGRKVLAACDAKPQCRAALGGDSVAALTRIEQDPRTAERIGADPKLFFGALLDHPQLRAQIPAVIAGLLRDDDSALRRAKDELQAMGTRFARFPQSPASSPLAGIISSSENNGRPGLSGAQVKTEQQGALFTSPLPGLLTEPGFPTYEREADFGRLPATMPPTLVLQGDLDSKTDFEAARDHSELLRQSAPLTFHAIPGAPHFVLFAVPDCFAPLVRDFVTGEQKADNACGPKLVVPF